MIDRDIQVHDAGLTAGPPLGRRYRSARCHGGSGNAHRSSTALGCSSEAASWM
ncbi:hypothetical protein [Nocardia nova]|uniref:hypothetical protein n=1 Tax=Nocardia nova TaxID=37330 RepID=UPI0004B3EBDC|nr:hypothetical protein [Nocardia nova]